MASLTATADPGNTLLWYNVATNGSPLSAGTAITTGTYYVSQQTPAGCEGPRTPVTVTVNTTPVLTATPGGPITVCSGAQFSIA
ncbi:hypothetical protein ACSTLM_00470, partial [Vibrio parahaemolyticus]